MTIGATENDRPNFSLTYQQAFGATDYPANPIASDRMANDPDGMVAFSSRGPRRTSIRFLSEAGILAQLKQGLMASGFEAFEAGEKRVRFKRFRYGNALVDFGVQEA